MAEESQDVGTYEITAQSARKAFRILQAAFVLVPLIAGLDKFLNLLVPWETYLAPVIPQITRIPARALLQVAGIVELAIAFLIAFIPKVGGYSMALWLWAIIVNLLLIPGYWDVALRDFGLSLGALALARLSLGFPRPSS